MKTNKILTAILACSIVGSVTAAPKAQWTTSISSNNKAALISTKINSPMANISHEAVSFSYKLDSSKALNFDSKAFVENSRQFWLDSTGAELQKGLSLPVTGGETIIRISPLTNDKSIQISAADIEITNNGMQKSINVFADSADLKATGAAFSDNSIALKVQSVAGSLNLKLASSTGKMPFVIHVLEADSPYVLSLKSTKATYGANQTISIDGDLLFDDKSLNTNLQGYISRPDGSILGELNFGQNKKGGYSAEIDAIGSQGLTQGLWEVHVFSKALENGIEIMRDAQTSFAVNLNTAEFNNSLKMSASNIEVGINVGLEGRYEVRGVLMGTNKAGVMQPIAMTMTADWLSVGKQAINLNLDKKLISESGLSAPFALKNVQLTNQTYLAPVQMIKAGIKIQGLDLIRDFDLIK